MKNAVKIPAWRILTNWLITVVVGSIIWPVLAAIMSSSDGQELITVIFISMVLSATFSIPATLILYFTNLALNDNGSDVTVHRRVHMLVHALVGVATFAVLFFAIGVNELETADFFLSIPFVYIATGLVTSFFSYRMYSKEIKDDEDKAN